MKTLVFVIVCIVFSVSNFLIFSKDAKKQQLTWQLKVWRMIFIFSSIIGGLLVIEGSHSFFIHCIWGDEAESLSEIVKFLMYGPAFIYMSVGIYCFRILSFDMITGLVKVLSWGLGLEKDSIIHTLIGYRN